MLKEAWTLVAVAAACFLIGVQSISNSSTSRDPEVIGEKENRWKIAWITPVVMKAMVNYIPSGQNNRSICTEQGQIYAEHLANLTYWAVKMFDSSSFGVSPGILEGRNYEYGHFDECVSAKSEEHGISGKYMMARLFFAPYVDVFPEFNRTSKEWMEPKEEESAWKAIKPTSDRRISTRNVLNWAICVPSSCSESDIVWSLRRILYPALQAENIAGNLTIFTDYTYSRVTATQQPGYSYYVFLSVGLALVATVLLTTLYDVLMPEEMKKPWYNAFSLKKNWNRLVDGRANEFACMSGLKVLSMFLIIYGHRMLITVAEPEFNPNVVQLAAGNFFATIVENGTVVVNTFMAITGFLTFYKITKDVESKRDLYVGRSILNRWLRLTPAYLAVMAGYYYILPYLEGGPMSRSVIWDPNTFGQYWWTHLLYINNYVYSRYQVLVPSWYMAFDIQMYIFSYLLGAALKKKWKLTPYVLTLAVLISLLCPVYVIVTHAGYSGTYLIHHMKPFNYLEHAEFRDMYIPTHVRAAPYVIGMLGGYLYYYVKKRGLNIGPITLFMVTTVNGAGLILSLTLAWVFYIPSRPYVLWEHLAYSIFHRVFWAVPIVWMIFASAICNFSLLKVSLCGSLYEALNKLNYSALLVHSVLQLWLVGYIRSPENYGRIVGAWMGCGDVAFAYFAAALIYLFVEAPFSNLQQTIPFLIIPRAPRDDPNKK